MSEGDHDRLIRIDENVKTLIKNSDDFGSRIQNLETQASEVKGGWKAILAAGSIGGAVAAVASKLFGGNH